MNKTYYHPKDLDTITIECFISHLRNKRKKGEETPIESVLEDNLRTYLKERNIINESSIPREELGDFSDRAEANAYFIDLSKYIFGTDPLTETDNTIETPNIEKHVSTFPNDYNLRVAKEYASAIIKDAIYNLKKQKLI